VAEASQAGAMAVVATEVAEVTAVVADVHANNV
jgi:hypothetical protein